MNGKGIEINHVTKKYNNSDYETTALKDITLTIRAGEYIGLMGMNGSGKSTLVRLLNGLIKPTEGKIYIDGMDTGCPENTADIRSLVGIVFQNPDNQLICPVVEEEIAFGLENLGLPLPEINRRIDWALQAVGLNEMKHHSPHLLSGGQKQKVALASVLAMLPSYLILDEPTSMLDPLSREELLEQLRILNTERGMTIVLSSHNPEDLIHANRLIVIEQGSVYLQGTPREVYSEETKLAALGLEQPDIYQLISQLESEGYNFDDSIRTIPELVDKICQK